MGKLLDQLERNKELAKLPGGTDFANWLSFAFADDFRSFADPFAAFDTTEEKSTSTGEDEDGVFDEYTKTELLEYLQSFGIDTAGGVSELNEEQLARMAHMFWRFDGDVENRLKHRMRGKKKKAQVFNFNDLYYKRENWDSDEAYYSWRLAAWSQINKDSIKIRFSYYDGEIRFDFEVDRLFDKVKFESGGSFRDFTSPVSPGPQVQEEVVPAPGDASVSVEQDVAPAVPGDPVTEGGKGSEAEAGQVEQQVKSLDETILEEKKETDASGQDTRQITDATVDQTITDAGADAGPGFGQNEQQGGATDAGQQEQVPVDNTTVTEKPEDILWKRDNSNKHKWNNTGVVFERRDGKPLTSGEVYNFIREQKKAGNQEFIDTFNPHIKGEDPEGTAPTFEIKNSKWKYYQYSFDPNWGKEEEKDTYFGEAVNQKAIVRLQDQNGESFLGIRLHTTPAHADSDYQNKTGDAVKIYTPGESVVILNKANDKNPGWVYIQTTDGKKGWIEEHWLTKTGEGYKKDYTLHTVQPNEGVEDLLRNIEGFQRDIGYDNRAAAYVLLLMNEGNKGVYINQEKYDVERQVGLKDLADPWYAEMRAIYRSIEVQAGAVVRVPTKEGLDKMIAEGKVPTRPELVNLAIKGGRIIEGLLVGIPIGMAKQAADMVTGIWDLVKSIFSGEILDQLVELYNAISEMSLGDLGEFMLLMLGINADEFKDIWNSGNIEVYERYKYVGEIIGRLLFEIILTVLSGGAKLATIAAKVPALAKVAKVLAKVEQSMMKVDKLIPEEIAGDMRKIEKGTDKVDDVSKVNKVDNLDELKKLDTDINGKKSTKAKEYEAEVDADTKKKLDDDAKKEVDDELKNDPKKDKKLAVLIAAKAIAEGADIAGATITAVLAELFPLGPLAGVTFNSQLIGEEDYSIHMKGSDLIVDNSFSSGKKSNYKEKEGDASLIKKRQPELGGKTAPSGGRSFSKKKGERPEFLNSETSGQLKGHTKKHGGEGQIIPDDPEAYLNQAIDNMNFGQEFKYYHDGQFKTGYISKVGDNQYLFTGTTQNGKGIFTHTIVDEKYLNNTGITLAGK